MKKINLSIEGMTCSACSNGLEKFLNKQNGVKQASVNLVMANASIEYDEKILNISQIEEFVKRAGFKSLGEFKELKEETKSNFEKFKFIIFTILAILLIYISMGHMVNLPTFDLINRNINSANHATCLFLIAILFIIYGLDILKNLYKNFIHKTPNMDTLVTIGVVSSFAYSIYSMTMIIKGNINFINNLYFESAAIVIYFIKLGRYLDRVSKDKTKEAIQKLVSITPKYAIIKVNGEEKQVTIDEIKIGDVVICRPGEKIAVDGEIIFGAAHIDESFITGESKPVSKEIAKKVIAGSINYDGYIEYKAEKIGKNSTISEIVKLVVEASNTKAPISKIADKVSGYFVPTVIVIAVITFFVYLLLGYTFSYSLITFVTVLVVACPCSLGLATPLAIIVSEGVCAEKGILVKKSEIIENARKIDTILFDKTGTLTYGKLKISELKNYTDFEDKEIIKIVGSLENKSTHPIAKAFIDYLQENKLEKLEVKDFKNIEGFGIKGIIEGKEIIIGNSKILEKFSIKNEHEKDEKKLVTKQNSIVYVVQNRKILALIGVNDVVRRETKKVIELLNKNKIETIMITGDTEKTAQEIAKQISIKKVIANVLPRQKTEVVRKLKQEKKCVMMCGDGINDSPALTTADIGISVNTGTDIAIDSADVILIKNDLMGILDLIDISKKTIKIIKQNLFWAFFYNILMIPVAVGFFSSIGISINPMLASIAMVVSSLTVILNTLRIDKNFSKMSRLDVSKENKKSQKCI